MQRRLVPGGQMHECTISRARGSAAGAAGCGGRAVAPGDVGCVAGRPSAEIGTAVADDEGAVVFGAGFGGATFLYFRFDRQSRMSSLMTLHALCKDGQSATFQSPPRLIGHESRDRI